jgi:hypothetical protein
MCNFVYCVSNKTSILLFKTRLGAEKYVASFPASIAGGFFIYPMEVFDVD